MLLESISNRVWSQSAMGLESISNGIEINQLLIWSQSAMALESVSKGFGVNQ